MTGKGIHILLAGLLISLISFCSPLNGQTAVRITRYQPGEYLADNLHEVELFNAGSRPADLSGWMLVCRDYAVRLPAGATIPPESTLRLHKRLKGRRGLELASTPDFLMRFHDREIEGNFIALLSPGGRIQDAFYFSPLKEAPFLPTVDTLVTFDRRYVPYTIPSERSPVWKWVKARDLPGQVFVRDGESWKLRTAEALAVEYTGISARYSEGVVRLKWSGREFERDLVHVVERSEDQRNFTEVGEVKGRGGSDLQQYAFIETGVPSGKTFFYRIRAKGPGVENQTSRLAELNTVDGQDDFELEAFTAGGEVTVRFYSRYSQRLRIRVLDDRRRNVALIFDDYVYADARSLLKITRELPPGRYLVLAETESSRYGKEFVVETYAR